jgi:hypothetical protein
MRETGESVFGINWNTSALEEGWEEEEDEIQELEPHINSRKVLQSERTSSRLWESGSHKITVYLPNAIFQKLRQRKKLRCIRSYSEAIAQALSKYLD